MSELEKLQEFQTTKHCPVCGKVFSVLWPTQWAFRRKNSYICSWKCIRLYDRSEEGVKKEMQLGEKSRKALEIALDGGDPVAFLREQGSKNPSAAWCSIKSQIRDKDPETWERLTAIKKKAPAPDPEYLTDEEVKKIAGAVKISPATYRGKRVVAMMGDFGTYYLDDQTRSGEAYLDYSNRAGDELSMTVSQWRAFIKELKEIALYLGVEL